MRTQIPVIAGLVCAAAALIMVAGSLSAQGGQQPDTHGIPSPEVLVGDGRTVPIKIDTREYDKAKLLSPPPLSEEAQAGRIIWLQKCAFCHDGVGQPTYKTMGPWLGAETIEIRGEDTVRSVTASGTNRMPGFRYSLDPARMDQLIAFLKTIPTSTKPTAAQLAGRNTGPSND